jgi:uncharacterized membrane protein YkvA (DUF1232 family)
MAEVFKPGKGERAIEKIQARTRKTYIEAHGAAHAQKLDRAADAAAQGIEQAASRSEDDINRDQAKVEAGFWDKVKRVARQIPFLQDLVAAYYAMRDPNTPLQARAVLVFGLLYFLWIFDVIPDFLGVIGYVDDGTVLTVIITQVGDAITDKHRSEAAKALGM